MLLKLSSYFFRMASEDQQNIHALCTAFQDNTRMKALVGQNGQRLSKGIQIVIYYCYFMVKKWKGIFRSQNKATFLLFYRKSEYYFSFKDMLHYLYLAFSVIGLSRLKKVYEREQLIRQIREQHIQQCQDTDYLYVWFLAQKKEQKDLAGLIEAKAYIIQQSKNLNLPIYMETTDARLVPIYERMGFQFYTYREEASADLKLWFGRYTTKT